MILTASHGYNFGVTLTFRAIAIMMRMFLFGDSEITSETVPCKIPKLAVTKVFFSGGKRAQGRAKNGRWRLCNLISYCSVINDKLSFLTFKKLLQLFTEYFLTIRLTVFHCFLAKNVL